MRLQCACEIAPALITACSKKGVESILCFIQGLVSHATTKWLKALKLLNQIFAFGDEEERKVRT